MNLSDSLFAYQKYIKHGKYHDGHQVFHEPGFQAC